jgi:hypothetical protein
MAISVLLIGAATVYGTFALVKTALDVPQRNVASPAAPS